MCHTVWGLQSLTHLLAGLSQNLPTLLYVTVAKKGLT